jgi:hypothetical protein
MEYKVVLKCFLYFFRGALFKVNFVLLKTHSTIASMKQVNGKQVTVTTKYVDVDMTH